MAWVQFTHSLDTSSDRPCLPAQHAALVPAAEKSPGILSSGFRSEQNCEFCSKKPTGCPTLLRVCGSGYSGVGEVSRRRTRNSHPFKMRRVQFAKPPRPTVGRQLGRMEEIIALRLICQPPCLQS